MVPTRRARPSSRSAPATISAALAVSWSTSTVSGRSDDTEGGTREVGGIDLFTVRDGRFAQGWSITGTRPVTC